MSLLPPSPFEQRRCAAELMIRVSRILGGLRANSTANGPVTPPPMHERAWQAGIDLLWCACPFVFIIKNVKGVSRGVWG